MDGAQDTEQSALSPITQAVDANQSLLITYFPYTPYWVQNQGERRGKMLSTHPKCS